MRKTVSPWYRCPRCSAYLELTEVAKMEGDFIRYHGYCLENNCTVTDLEFVVRESHKEEVKNEMS